MLPVIDTQLESTGVLLQKPIVHEFVKDETSPCQGVKILKQDIQTLPALWRQTLTPCVSNYFQIHAENYKITLNISHFYSADSEKLPVPITAKM